MCESAFSVFISIRKFLVLKTGKNVCLIDKLHFLTFYGYVIVTGGIVREFRPYYFRVFCSKEQTEYKI